jgi:hypothetical protein
MGKMRETRRMERDRKKRAIYGCGVEGRQECVMFSHHFDVLVE